MRFPPDAIFSILFHYDCVVPVNNKIWRGNQDYSFAELRTQSNVGTL